MPDELDPRQPLRAEHQLPRREGDDQLSGDDSPDAVEGEKCVCSDDDVFRHLAALYADNHPFMWTG